MKLGHKPSKPLEHHHHAYYFWLNLSDGAIPGKLLTLLESEIESAPLSPVTVRDPVTNGTVRQHHVVGLGTSHWFTGIMFNYAALANDLAKWNRTISVPEVAQFSAYKSGDFFRWRNDVDPLSKSPQERKLTAICLLSDPSEFDGGQLQIRGLAEPINLKRGSVVVFPSMLDHQITEVTRGVLRTVTCWAVGPNSFSA